MQADIKNYEQVLFLRKLIFRFAAAFFFVYIFPFPLYYLPLVHILSTGYQHLIHILVLWTGEHVFHASLPAHPRGDISDGIYQYVKLFVLAVIAVFLFIIWCFTTRIKKYDDSILYWVSVYVRYRFVIRMLKYGFDKIQKVQFPFPYGSLTETYGESSPMRLMWNFMGYSTAYNVFIGILEAGAGFLLLFRKTRLLGALISIAVLSHIVILNFCFDVPVKMHSLILLLMAIFIAAPDAKRLSDFLLNKAVPAQKEYGPEYGRRWTKPLLSILSFCIIAATVYVKAGPVWRQYTSHDETTFREPPLYGIYTIEQFVRNPDLKERANDVGQWKSLSILQPKRATVKMENSTFRTYSFHGDTLNKRIHLYNPRDSVQYATLVYEVPDSIHLIMRGKLQGDSVVIALRKQNLNRYELLNRKSHWINEYPYNK